MAVEPVEEGEQLDAPGRRRRTGPRVRPAGRREPRVSRSASSIRPTSTSAAADASSSGQNSPSRPARTTSGMPPTAAASTGSPSAMASTRTIPKLSMVAVWQYIRWPAISARASA